MAPGGQFGEAYGVQVTLGWQFEGPNGVQVALGGQFEAQNGVQEALGGQFGGPSGARRRVCRTPVVPDIAQRASKWRLEARLRQILGPLSPSSSIRSEPPGRNIGIDYYITILIYYYITILLNYYTTILLYYYITIYPYVSAGGFGSNGGRRT